MQNFDKTVTDINNKSLYARTKWNISVACEVLKKQQQFSTDKPFQGLRKHNTMYV